MQKERDLKHEVFRFDVSVCDVQGVKVQKRAKHLRRELRDEVLCEEQRG
jgi:hypothetical protein